MLAPMSKIGMTLAGWLVAWAAVLPAAVTIYDPREALTEERVKSTHDTFIIYVGKSMNLDADQTAIVRRAFAAFREQHTYTDDGEMVALDPGKPCPDTPEALDEFFRACAVADFAVKSGGRIRCPVCAGSGALYYESVMVGGGLTRFRAVCVDCLGKGILDRNVTFVLRCVPTNMPDKPPTPRQLRLKRLILAAKKGEPESMLLLADEFMAGRTITRNLVDAKNWYKGAALKGKVAGLAGYHEAARLDSPDYRQKRLLVAMAKAVSDLGGKVRQELADDDLRSRGPCLARIRTRILSEAIALAFQARKLGEAHFDYARLLQAVAAAKPAPGDDQAAGRMGQALRAWITAGEPEKMEPAAMVAFQESARLLNPEAFAILGDVYELGMAGPPNPQAAHACFSIAKSLRDDPLVARSLARLEPAVDTGVTADVLGVFRQQAASGGCTQTFLESLAKLKTTR
jgi:TPR repeat protein